MKAVINGFATTTKAGKPRCQGRVFKGWGYQVSQCKSTGAHVDGDFHYCAKHSPSAKAAREDAKLNERRKAWA